MSKPLTKKQVAELPLSPWQLQVSYRRYRDGRIADSKPYAVKREWSPLAGKYVEKVRRA